MRVLVISLIILLAGCSLTPTQKKWAGFAASVLVVGAIAAHDDDNSSVTKSDRVLSDPNPPCRIQPDGSCR